jgi:hypothetical protein
MDFIFIGALLVFFLLTWLLVVGCARLGGKP